MDPITTASGSASNKVMLVVATSALLRSKPSTVLPTAERHFFEHGCHANSYSVAFDPDLQRHITADGVVAFARNDLMGVTTVFFDPLCDEIALPDVLDGFIDAVQRTHPNDRIAFWKVGCAVADLLAERGYLLAPYGIENDVWLPRELGGTRLRGLRRQVDAARRRRVGNLTTSCRTEVDKRQQDESQPH